MSNQISLKDKSIVELKAMAYDIGILINEYKNLLNSVNQEIINKANEKPVEPAPIETIEAPVKKMQKGPKIN